MKFVVALAALALVTGLLAFGGTDASADRDEPASSNTIPVFVTFRDDFDGDGDTRDKRQEEQSEDEFVRSHGGRVSHRYSVTDAVAIDVAPEDFGALTADARVESVETDVTASILNHTNSGCPLFPTEADCAWGVKHVGSAANRTAGYRGAGVKIGIIDTGINTAHVDLAPNYDPACSYDFVNNDTNPMDDHGHGSHVAGTAAGADNGTGVVGMAPDATLCGYKVLGSTGSGSYSAILAALDRAVADGVDVVNLSLGSGYPGSVVEAAFATAHSRGLTIVAAAGNESPCDGSLPPADNEIYPAKFPNVIAVAATNSDNNTRACFSSVGADVEIAAPGGIIVESAATGSRIWGIWSAFKGSNTALASMIGTSMATPHVAGLAAVMLGCGMSITNDDVAFLLASTAKDLDSPLVAGVLDGRDTWFGYGLIQAASAASAAGCQASAPATATPANTSTSTPTRTNTPTATQTNTPLPPTATPTNAPVVGGGPLLFSLGSSATLSGATYQNEDIVAWDGTAFTMFFDGSDVMPTSFTIDGFAFVGTNEILVTFTEASSLPGAGSFDDSDVLRFQATSLGGTTAGTWSMYFDASDVGLSSSEEDVDGLEMLPNGQLLISTTGSFSVTGVSGKDEDVIKFAPTMLGTTTNGSWSMYFDGSDVSLNNDRGAEDIDGLAVSGSGSLYLSTTGSFSVPDLSGQDEDIFVFAPATLGSATAGTYVSLLFFDGSTNGLGSNDVVDIDLP